MPSSSSGTLSTSCMATCGEDFRGLCALYLGESAATDCPSASTIAPCQRSSQTTYYQCFNVTGTSLALALGSEPSLQMPVANVGAVGALELGPLTSLTLRGQGSSPRPMAFANNFLTRSTALTHLTLSTLAVPAFPSKQLPTTLQSLELINCNLTTWPVADALVHLTALDLSDNQFRVLPAAITSDLPRLRALNLSTNPLSLQELQAPLAATFFARLGTFTVDVHLCSSSLATTFTSASALAAAACTASDKDSAPDAPRSLLSPSVIALIAVAGVIAILGVLLVLWRCKRGPRPGTTRNVERSQRVANDDDDQDVTYFPGPKTKTAFSPATSSVRPALVSSLKRVVDPAMTALATKYATDNQLESLCLPSSSVIMTRLLARSNDRVYEVWLGTFEDSHVAIKKLALHVTDVEGCASALYDELKALARLSHPNILRVVGVLLPPASVAGVLAYCAHGDLQSLLGSSSVHDDSWSWFERKYALALDLARALAYLHAQSPSVIHRDVRARSVLLDSRYRCQLSHFGSARVRSILDTMTQNVGTMQWIAPEMLRGEDYCEAIDVYSFGVVLTELATHAIPFRDYAHQEDPKRVLVQELMTGRAVPSFGDDCPDVVSRIGRQCLQLDPSKRPPIASIVEALERVERCEDEQHIHNGILV
ncbi:TKL protein kinase [Saprolegnia parasitica CBS 223.65]|uniref:TKL protein kinase n=1 Tax=Saprolegnia parasitica (strain CBS 223.65) TaxID=695850 RepID=A0A067CRJ3_SAPPC|nr:TKL protein kinase [Saprolegnia parasitica CBS 223.65]KDO33118.1 TKL protein kinase [Saprolegnia parasitica CBS 223.65]|eukprot:XP_012195885.1 TKL protein kinase [Saprolegnia parasitica CBS 223.65]